MVRECIVGCVRSAISVCVDVCGYVGSGCGCGCVGVCMCMCVGHGSEVLGSDGLSLSL